MAKALTGTTLGKYQIMERLGRGGMADVYRACQPGMDRIVAIKILHGHLSTLESFLKRFKRKTHTFGKLRHANIDQGMNLAIQAHEYYHGYGVIHGSTLQNVRQR